MSPSALRIAKLSLMTFIYLGLAVFMAFVALRTYQYTGGFSDIGTIAVVLGMSFLVLMIGRLAYVTLSAEFAPR